MSPEALVMSKKSWDKLSEEDQKLIRQAVAESVKVMRELWNKRVENSKKIVMAAGNEIIEDIDKKPFIDAMGPVYERFANTPKLKDLVKRIQAAN